MLNYNRICFSLVICFFLSIAAASPAAGEGGESEGTYREGKLVFIPSVEASYQYDSNYYLDETNEVSANTYVLKPGFEFGYTTPKSSVLLDYYLSFNEYTGDDLIKDDDYIGHDLSLDAQTQATDHFLLGIEENYRKSRDRGSLDTLGNDANREKYQTNDLSPWVFYSINDTWGMGAKYTYSILDYADNVNEDSMAHLGAFNMEYNLNRTSLLDLEYNIWVRDYDRDTSDYTSNQVILSYIKEFRLFSLSAGAGYHDRSFDDISANDFGTFVWEFILRGAYNKTNYLFTIDHNANDIGESEQYYKGLNIYAEVGRLFYDKFEVELAVTFRNRDYETSDRDEDVWIFSGGADYLFTDRFSLGVESGYETRDSNEAGRDYDNKYILVRAGLNFDVAPR